MMCLVCFLQSPIWLLLKFFGLWDYNFHQIWKYFSLNFSNPLLFHSESSISHKLGYFLLSCRSILINEYSTYCNSPNESISLIAICIMSLTGDRPVRRWGRPGWAVGDVNLQCVWKWGLSWFYETSRAGVDLWSCLKFKQGCPVFLSVD